MPVVLEAGLHRRLLATARACGATLFMVLQAGLAALLCRLGAGTDIPIGAPVSGRGDAALETLVGMFVNTLVLRLDVAGEPSFAALVERARRADLEAYAHQDVPFERLVEALNPSRAAGRARHPLFQVMLALDPALPAPLQLPGLAAEGVPVATGGTRFDLFLSLAERRGADGAPQGLQGALEFNRDLFDTATAERLAMQFARLLRGMAAAPTRPIDHLIRHPIRFGEHSPQHLVAHRHVVQGGGQGGPVEVAAQPHRDRNVIGRRRSLQPVQEPQPLLRERQRQRLGPRRGPQGLGGATTLQAPGQRRYGRGLE